MARETSLTENEKAANGPLPGDLSLYESELRGCESLSTPGYYPSLNGAEISDATRSGLFPFANFGGSFDGPNVVYAWRSEDSYQGATFICNRKPGELYLTGGNLPEAKGPVYPGPYVAKADATTGKQIWRTYLENANASGVWIGVTNLNIMANGNIVTSWANRIALLDGDTGRILKYNTLPTGTTPAGDASFKHLTIAPDGTLILKDQTRPTGCTEQGTLAIFSGLKKGLKQGNSVLVAVHPDTLEVMHWLQLPEPATTPHGIAMFDDRIAIYVSADAHAFRYFWDPRTKKLSLDESWVVAYLQEGQTTGDAPGIMGDWIVIQTNGIGSRKVASSVVAINTKDSSKMTSITPFGPLKRTQFSLAPPKTCIDLENDMLYSADAGIGKVAGIKLDQRSGEMKAMFVVDDSTFTFQPLIGPKEKRVLILSNMKPISPVIPRLVAFATHKYREQVTWREAATGRILAESDFLEPLSPNSLTPPGFGGRLYYPTGTGFYTLQVRPAPKSSE
jgi:hypothetical protein